MQEEMMLGKISDAVSAMTDDAAKHYLEIGQAYAELYPKPFKIELVKRSVNPALAMMRVLGDMAPCGMCLVHWPSRTILWSNNVYQKVFLETFRLETSEGMRIDEIVPGFNEAGLEEIFESVATTGAPFRTEGFCLATTGGDTYWDWSLASVPYADSGENTLMIQMQQVFPLQQRMMA